jgi:hypothetical protein
MRALVYHCAHQVKADTVPDSLIKDLVPGFTLFAGQKQAVTKLGSVHTTGASFR